ncbi:MAG: type II-A CRISPR-associated protein Csn2 [Anaeroplasma sp.]
MTKIFIESIGKVVEIDNGLYQIVIKNPKIYRNIALNIDSEIILSIDNKVFDLQKETIVIYDPLCIDINDIKIIKPLYKMLEKKIHENCTDDLFKMEKILFNLLDKLMISSDIQLEYDSQIDIFKLLSCVGIKYKYSNDYYLNLLHFLKINVELFFNKIFIFFGLSSVLDKEELISLNNELIKLNASVINFSFSSVSYNNTKLILDEDWCIL